MILHARAIVLQEDNESMRIRACLLSRTVGVESKLVPGKRLLVSEHEPLRAIGCKHPEPQYLATRDAAVAPQLNAPLIVHPKLLNPTNQRSWKTTCHPPGKGRTCCQCQWLCPLLATQRDDPLSESRHLSAQAGTITAVNGRT